ncbi:MAG TPA: hypothetical protein VNK43_04865 [Gemmatimonadales bacterium]|nr:hypothetical protein [Gemmatimonadales bacterium]
MPKLYNKATSELLGEISPEQLQFLIDQLEEEGPEDNDYFISRATLDMLEREGADIQLLSLLRLALGSEDEAEVLWVR